MVFALSAIPILIALGAAIDYNRAMNAKVRLQDATDAAILAASVHYQKASSGSVEAEAEAIAYANEVFDANLAGMPYSVADMALEVVFDSNQMVLGEAASDLPLIFGPLIGVDKISLTAIAVSNTTPAEKYEVVFVIDNSKSMHQGSHFTAIRDAVKDVIHTISESQTDDTQLRFGIVPWSSLVNINSEAPKNFQLISGNPPSSPSPAGSQFPPELPFESRYYLISSPEGEAYSYSQFDYDFEPVAWRGCIKSANNERPVNSAGQVLSPLTDTPPSGFSWPVALIRPELQTYDTGDLNNGKYGETNGGNQIAYRQYDELIDAWQHLAPIFNLIPIANGQPPYNDDVPEGEYLKCTQNSHQDGAPGRRNVHIPFSDGCMTEAQYIAYTENPDSYPGGTGTGPQPVPVSPINACVSDPNEFGWFQDGGQACPWQSTTTNLDDVSGPNINCPTAMLGLGLNEYQLAEKIDHMHPVAGGAHADIGLMWAMRMLSPRSDWTSFFGHEEPSDWSDPVTKKVVILISDGPNEASIDFEGYYGCSEADPTEADRGNAGPCWQAESGISYTRPALDNLMVDSCQALIDEGVMVVSMAVDVTDSDHITALQQCAGNYAFDVTTNELSETMLDLFETQVCSPETTSCSLK